MSHRVCSRCGAPLPASAELVQRCEFCGVENERVPGPAKELAPRPSPIPPPYVPPPASPGSSGAVIALAVGSFALVAGGVGVALLSARQTTATTVEPSVVVVPPVPTGPVEPPALPVAALHGTPLTWTTDVKIDAPGRVGTLDHFDALANWDWAQSIATAWWSDAKPYQLVVDPVGVDGTVDLTAPAVASVPPSAKFHFVSLDCRASETKRAETELKFEKTSCTLEVEVTGHAVSVRLDLIGADGGGSKPIARPPCGIDQVFNHLAATRKLTARPTYSIWLSNDASGYAYSVAAGLGSAQMDALDVSPTFCGKTTPKPSAAGVQSAAVPSSAPTASDAPPFDRGAAIATLSAAGIESCRPPGDTTSLRVTVRFEPTGNVSAVTVAVPDGGSPFSKCAGEKARNAHVPPFSGSAVSVSKTYGP